MYIREAAHGPHLHIDMVRIDLDCSGLTDRPVLMVQSPLTYWAASFMPPTRSRCNPREFGRREFCLCGFGILFLVALGVVLAIVLTME